MLTAQKKRKNSCYDRRRSNATKAKWLENEAENKQMQPKGILRRQEPFRSKYFNDKVAKEEAKAAKDEMKWLEKVAKKEAKWLEDEANDLKWEKLCQKLAIERQLKRAQLRLQKKAAVAMKRDDGKKAAVATKRDTKKRDDNKKAAVAIKVQFSNTI